MNKIQAANKQNGCFIGLAILGWARSQHMRAFKMLSSSSFSFCISSVTFHWIHFFWLDFPVSKIDSGDCGGNWIWIDTRYTLTLQSRNEIFVSLQYNRLFTIHMQAIWTLIDTHYCAVQTYWWRRSRGRTANSTWRELLTISSTPRPSVCQN